MDQNHVAILIIEWICRKSIISIQATPFARKRNLVEGSKTPKPISLHYCINHKGCVPSPERVLAITKFPKPKTIVELRRSLGMVNFYRKNLSHAAGVQAPLQKFLSDSRENDKRPILWDSDSEAAFDQVKNDLCQRNITFSPCSQR